MKNLCILFFLFGLSLVNIYAQSSSLARSFYESGDIPNALSSIQKAVAGSDKNNADAWFLMYQIYKSAETSSTFSSFPDDCVSGQHYAISGLMNLPDGKAKMEQEFGSNYVYIFNKFYSELVQFAQKSLDVKNFGAALKNYKNALKVYENIYKYGLDNSSIDTALTYSTGYCAVFAKKYDDAEKYFKIIYDSNVQSISYVFAYIWLAKYYITEKKDNVSALAFVQKGLLYHPEDKELLDIKQYLSQ